MLTITDGYASDIVTPIGSELRDMGVIMLAIGYGTETPLMRFNLESISSEPKEQFTFIIPYDQLIEKTQQIVKKACTGKIISQDFKIYRFVSKHTPWSRKKLPPFSRWP